MTVNSILNTPMKEFVGRFNIVICFKGVFFQLPLLELNNHPTIQRYFDTTSLWMFEPGEQQIIADLKGLINDNYFKFNLMLKRCIVEGSRLDEASQ